MVCALALGPKVCYFRVMFKNVVLASVAESASILKACF